ncbi:MAG: hypothetical protein INR73_19585 [Williamsia sp.]|nr:hypothetical protein [Williamsia sp.]
MKARAIFTLLLAVFFLAGRAQKGAKSIAAGPLISFPLATESGGGRSNLNPGFGLEAVGQYNLSDKSALLLKATLASWGYKYIFNPYGAKRLTLLTLQGGYKYQFGSSGFFINGLLGTDIELRDTYASISFTVGAGKRFILKNNRFIDAGIDVVGGDAEGRVNLKAIFSLFQWLAAK